MVPVAASGCAIFRAILLFVLAVLPWFATAAEPAQRAPSAAELQVVHCLLPGQLRQLGRRTTYVSARRPVRTTARECRIRGGEYVLSDRANLKTALAVWLNAAQAGDAEAQATVGEIFEQGLGVAPDYDAARAWYARAAEQGLPRALTSLGNLYEQGLGVAPDPARALGFYRRAAGLPPQAPLALEQAGDVAPLELFLQREVDRLKAALGALRTETGGLRSALTAARAGLQDAQAAAERANAAHLAAEAARLDEAERAEQFAAAAEQAAVERATLDRKLESFAAFERQLKARDARIVQLSLQLDLLRGEQSAERVETTALLQEVEQLQALITKQRTQLAAAQTDRSLLAALEADLSETVASQRETLAAQRQALNAQRAELEAKQAESLAQAGEVRRLLQELAALEARVSTVRGQPAEVDLNGANVACRSQRKSGGTGIAGDARPCEGKAAHRRNQRPHAHHRARAGARRAPQPDGQRQPVRTERRGGFCGGGCDRGGRHGGVDCRGRSAG